MNFKSPIADMAMDGRLRSSDEWEGVIAAVARARAAWSVGLKHDDLLIAEEERLPGPLFAELLTVLRAQQRFFEWHRQRYGAGATIGFRPAAKRIKRLLLKRNLSKTKGR